MGKSLVPKINKLLHTHINCRIFIGHDTSIPYLLSHLFFFGCEKVGTTIWPFIRIAIQTKIMSHTSCLANKKPSLLHRTLKKPKYWWERKREKTILPIPNSRCPRIRSAWQVDALLWCIILANKKLNSRKINQQRTLFHIPNTSRASLRYFRPASHIWGWDGRGSTFLVVYRAAMASMERRRTLGTAAGANVLGGDGVEDQDTSEAGLSALICLKKVKLLSLDT